MMTAHASKGWISSGSLRFWRFLSSFLLAFLSLIVFSLGARAEDYYFPELTNVPVGDGSVTSNVRMYVSDYSFIAVKPPTGYEIVSFPSSQSFTDSWVNSRNQVLGPSGQGVDSLPKIYMSDIKFSGILNFRVLFLNNTDSPKVVANQVFSIALNRQPVSDSATLVRYTGTPYADFTIPSNQIISSQTFKFNFGDYAYISDPRVTGFTDSDIAVYNNIYTSSSPTLKRSSNVSSYWPSLVQAQGNANNTPFSLNLNIRYQNYNNVSSGFLFVPAHDRLVVTFSIPVEFFVRNVLSAPSTDYFTFSVSGNLINGVPADTPVHDQGLQQQQQQQFEEFTDSGTNSNGSSDAYDGTLNEINNALDQGFGSQLTMLSTDVVNIFDPQGVGNPRLTLPALTWTQDGTTYTIWPERTFGFNSLNNNWGLSFLKTAVNFATVACVYLALHRYLMRKINWFLAH